MIAGWIVKLAVRLLPTPMRDRYREQWGADLRDAEGAGVSRFDVATGALAFAASAERVVVTVPGSVEQRARLASALALSTAIVMITQYANIVRFGGLTGNSVYDFVFQFLAPGLLLLYVVVAPLVALVMVTTRGMATSVRWAVVLLVIASLAPLAQSLIDNRATSINNVYLTVGTAAYLVAVALALVAVGLLARHFRWMDAAPGAAPRRPLAAIVGALALVVVGVLGEWNAQLWLVANRNESLAFQDRLAESGYTNMAQFAADIARSEQASCAALVAWAVFVALLVALVLGAGLSRRVRAGRSVIHSIAALCFAALAYAGVTSYLKLMSVGGIGAAYSPPEEVLIAIAQWTLIAIVLTTVGGVRFTRTRVTVPAAA